MTAAVILGAAVWADGPSPTLRRRTAHAARLYHSGKVQRVIACGGLGRHPPTEAEVMRDLLIRAGVPSEAIVLEDRSVTTAENIGLAAPLIGDDDVLLVSDWYHLPRACFVAARAGLKARGAAAPLNGANPWVQLKGALREVPALLAYLLRLRG